MSQNSSPESLADHARFPALAASHDLRLPAWGPYTNRYMGFSHIPDADAGLRFDFSVFPALYRRSVQVPNARWDSGFHIWNAATDLSSFSVRYELIWKDLLYCDTEFIRLDDQSVRVECRLVNRTEVPQNLALHFVANLNFPPVRPYSDEVLKPSLIELPAAALWMDALDYESFESPRFDPRATLTTDGYIRGQVRDHGFVAGNGVALRAAPGAAKQAGDRLSFRVTVPDEIPDACLVLRYRAASEGELFINLDGLCKRTVPATRAEGFVTTRVEAGSVFAGEYVLGLAVSGSGELQLDGVALVPTPDLDALRFVPVDWNSVPERIAGPVPGSLILKYVPAPAQAGGDGDMSDAGAFHYGIAWEAERAELREFFCSDLDVIMRRLVHDHVSATFRGPGRGHYTNVFMRPLFLDAGEERVIRGFASSGSLEDVRDRLSRQTAESWTVPTAPAAPCDMSPVPAGEPYRFSQERMAATVLSNVVYPVHSRGTYIRNYSPGRWWDSLYTWDAGFIGIGLADLDVERAIDCLNAYVTAEGDRDAAFIHHGSPVPVQIYLFLELWNRTQSRELLEYFYPRCRQYHRFLAGRLGSSTTRNLKSNLLRTWDYFYNSGGWDDYPPQVHVHKQKLTANVAPTSNSAHAVRTARILRAAALALGDATAEFDADIAAFTEALQQHAWDPDAGYFGYVCHDESGSPTGILRHDSGANFNMGLDGCYPLVAGICTTEQRQRLCDNIMTHGRMWSPWGISTVDQSAPYYRPDGYWNGAVWMPHQWFFWKTMLDLGRTEDAWRIARTALDMWKREVDETYNCFEHFMVGSGRGAGWHQFGALSSPVLNWYTAYFRPGRVTTGFDAWIEAFQPDDGGGATRVQLLFPGGPSHAPAVIVTTPACEHYEVTWQGTRLKHAIRIPGTVEVLLPPDVTSGELIVRRVLS